MPVFQYAGVPVVMLSSLGDIELDMVEDVTIREESLVTQHPTETGISLSDHIVTLPTAIQLSGRFVDYPMPDLVQSVVTAFIPQLTAVVGIAGAIDSLLSGPTKGRSITMWQALEQLRLRKELIEVNVQQGTYLNMAIKNLSGPRSSGDGGSQRFTIDMLEVVTSFSLLTDDQAVDDEFAHSANAVLDQGVKSLGLI